MLKRSSKSKLHRLATNDIFGGGVTALVIAKRIDDPEAMKIVSDVYCSSFVQKNPYI